MNPPPTLSCIDVTKQYAKGESTLTALDTVTLSVKEGEFVSLVGPSGCGKSTLLALLDGLLPPTSGQVLYRGQPLLAPRSEIGMMFQHPTLLPWRTVEENAMLPHEIRHSVGPESRKRVRETLDLVGLTGFEESYPRELSGGMAQRAALCRSIASDPDIMLLDEPFGALDEFTREAMNFELMHVYDKTKKTIVFVTHNIGEAVFMSDRVVVMTPRPGRIAAILEPGLERPRTLKMLRSAPYLDAVFKIRELLGLSD